MHFTLEKISINLKYKKKLSTQANQPSRTLVKTLMGTLKLQSNGTYSNTVTAIWW